MDRRAIVVVPALLALLVALAAGAAGASGGTARAMPSLDVLLQQALVRVQAADHGAFKHAELDEADGYTRGAHCGRQGCSGGSRVSTASGVVAWQFVYTNPAAQARYHSATVAYGPWPKNRFGPVVGSVHPTLGDVVITHAPKLSLARAVSRLRGAGYRSGFTSVTLRNPLGPKPMNPSYVFELPQGSFIGVDSVTGKVRRFS